jgi:hypothetical protein
VYTDACYVSNNLTLKSKLLLTCALAPFTQQKTHQHFMGCHKTISNRQKTMRGSEKTANPPQWLYEPLDCTKLSMLVITRVIYEHVKSEAAQAGFALVDPAPSSTYSQGCQAAGLLSSKSPTSMGSVTRTISSFQPYVLSSPGKRTPSKKHLLK